MSLGNETARARIVPGVITLVGLEFWRWVRVSVAGWPIAIAA